MKRNMSVNIFLKRFKMEPEVIVRMIELGEESSFRDEKLKGLLSVLPSKEEVGITP